MSTPNESRPATRMAILSALEQALKYGTTAIPEAEGQDAGRLEQALTVVTDEVSPGARQYAIDTLAQKGHFLTSDVSKAVARAVIQAWKWGHRPPTGELLTEMALYELRRTLLRATGNSDLG